MDIAKSFPDMLMTNLAESNIISVVERIQIDKAIKNFNIEALDLFDQENAIRVGKWLGATHIIIGSIYGIGNQIRIDSRVIDVSSGVVVSSAKIEGNSSDLFKLVNDISTRILSSFTGESKNFREIPDVLLDQIFSIGAPPANGPVRPHPETIWRDLQYIGFKVCVEWTSWSRDNYGNSVYQRLAIHAHENCDQTLIENENAPDHAVIHIDEFSRYNVRENKTFEILGNKLRIYLETIDGEFRPYDPSDPRDTKRNIVSIRVHIKITRA
jgi:TolB-like protein